MYYWQQPPFYTSAANETPQRRTERVYTEDVLNRNIGKEITLHLTYENNNQWNAMVVTGVLREVGRDFLLLRDQKTGKDMIFMNINIDYYIFESGPANLARPQR
ncbi:spore coat protein GerQ [Kroppenstedtia sanguinis]|uniref:Spore coat protein GerQ n=1 Tax=Kroppenstedtia sanguinis TaxID=1380684 RepID=A0ABW4C9H8_9BACL